MAGYGFYMGMFFQVGFLGGTVVKNLPANARDTRNVGSIPGSGRSPGEGNVNPFQYSCLENSMDRGAWWATVHRVANSWTRHSTCFQVPELKSLNFPTVADQEFLKSYELTIIFFIAYTQANTLTQRYYNLEKLKENAVNPGNRPVSINLTVFPSFLLPC